MERSQPLWILYHSSFILTWLAGWPAGWLLGLMVFFPLLHWHHPPNPPHPWPPWSSYIYHTHPHTYTHLATKALTSVHTHTHRHVHPMHIHRCGFFERRTAIHKKILIFSYIYLPIFVSIEPVINVDPGLVSPSVVECLLKSGGGGMES